MSISSPNYSPKDSGEWFTWISRRLRILERHTHSPIDEKRLGVSNLTYGPVAVGTLQLFEADAIRGSGDEIWSIRFSCAGVSSTVAADVVELQIRRGGFGGTVVGTCRKEIMLANIVVNGGTFETYDQPPAGNTTYAVTMIRQAGSGNCYVYPVMTMVVERAR